jgi:hypothetical protein
LLPLILIDCAKITQARGFARRQFSNGGGRNIIGGMAGILSAEWEGD